jgi:multidrug resistance protein MdtO
MAQAADNVFEGLGSLLAPFPGRLAFAVRLALICALTTLIVEIYQTPEPALTVYVAFFVMKPDRAASVVTSIVMLTLISLVLGLVLTLTVQVIEQPLWRVTTMVVVSFCLTFAASASKLKPVAGTVALITAYALDLLGSVPGGELATRGILYVWLFVAIPAGLCIVVNLALGPAPRRLAELALAHRLRLAASVLVDGSTRQAFKECLHEGPSEIPAWLKLAGAERTSSKREIAALQQALRSTNVILTIVDFLIDGAQPPLPVSIRQRIAETLDGMATILGKGGYPMDITLESSSDEARLTPIAAAGLAELRIALSTFTEEDGPLQATKHEGGGFFLPHAFTNPVHIHYALKTTGAAMFCYIAYMLLDWPGIHTCLITCFIVSLDTTAETFEKQALRFFGCGIGAGLGIAAMVFLMPNITSIGALMGVVFLAAAVAGWVAAGGPRIAYAGFQLAFAFFLCVVQGAAPAFDMTIARDRTIGIFAGDIVVAIVFIHIWPVTIVKRIDPAIGALLREVATLVSTASRPTRWQLAAELRVKLAAFRQDLALSRYEPSALRPARPWLDERWEVARTLSSLQAPLLIGTDENPAGFAGTARRLTRLAERIDGAGPVLAELDPMSGQATTAIDAHVTRLEHLVEQLSDHDAPGATTYAPA